MLTLLMAKQVRTFMLRRRDHPSGQVLVIIEPFQICQELDTNRLKNIRCVVFTQSTPQGNTVEKSGIALDKTLPRVAEDNATSVL